MPITLLPKNNWPERLQEIAHPPEKLYFRGIIPDWNKKFLCIVGSRKYTSYGKEVCEMLVKGLSGYPVIIVSGLALGIDGIAHRAALEAGLQTIAVPGSGLEDRVLYPSTHRTLAHSIIEKGGTLLSEFEPNFKATVWSFPQRNRIMAGLSHAVLIIEAEEKSGTLITARLATEYNRDVLTVPGNLFSEQSKGPHLLLRLGATIVRNADDIVEALGIEPRAKIIDLNEKYADCSPEELRVIEILKEPHAREALLHVVKLPMSELNALLSLLEIKGLIKEVAGEIYLQ